MIHETNRTPFWEQKNLNKSKEWKSGEAQWLTNRKKSLDLEWRAKKQREEDKQNANSSLSGSGRLPLVGVYFWLLLGYSVFPFVLGR